MQARLIAYPPDSAAIVCRPPADVALVIGRAADAGLRLDHSSVSREHAELAFRDGVWRMRDLGSKNGSFLDGGRITDAALGRECWLRFGDVYCEFPPITDAGSVGAGRRALDERRPVVVNDIGRESWLSGRDSVVAAGISALACLPLLEGGEAFGAIYADRVRPGPAITTLDLELLQAFVEGAAVWIAAQRTSALLAAQTPRPGRPATDWDGIIAAHGADVPGTPASEAGAA